MFQDSDPDPRSQMLYATFPRRLNALITDTILIVLFVGVLLVIAPISQDVEILRRLLVVLFYSALFLYEPIMVSRFGGTVGHWLYNLRVVDEKTGGHIRFWKAVVRFWIKGILGILSFLTMPFTRGHQAIHDLWTSSTVQIRDAAKAQPHHYVPEKLRDSQPVAR